MMNRHNLSQSNMKLHIKNLLKGIVLITALILIGCDTMYEIPEIIYLIKSGSHKSNVEGSLPNNGLRSLKTEVLEFTARFDESAVYDLGNGNQDDVNKLFGFSDCNSQHHQNSARFGWNFNTETGQVDIFSYVYRNENRIIEYLGSTEINETVLYRLRVSDNNFNFEFKDVSLQVERGSQCNIGLYYLLYPYFGGNETAPHDIRIHILEK